MKVFSHYFPQLTLQQAVFDVILLFIAVIAAIALQPSEFAVSWGDTIGAAALFAVLMIVINSVMGLYRPSGRPGSLRGAWMKIGFSLLISLPLAWLTFTLIGNEVFASTGVQLSIAILLSLVLAMRAIVNQRNHTALFESRVLIIGTGEDARQVEYSLTHPVQRGVQVIGFLPSGKEFEAVVDTSRVLQAPGGLLSLVESRRVNQIIVAVKERRGGALPIRELLDCKLAGVKVFDLSSFFERTHGQVPLDSLKASWLIYGDGFAQGWLRSTVKRIFDIAVAIALLILALPVMLITALLIVIEDGAPVFYRQERVGERGRIFKVIKFRSMRRDAEGDGKPRWAQSNDDRVTRVGRVIRKLRIDELPQLLNVLKGEMSLVGPRPERQYFVDQLAKEIPFYAVRHCVKPGVTGWAQVRYPYGASVEDAVQKLQYDIYYVKNHTLLLDTLILFETVRVVLTGEGAQ